MKNRTNRLQPLVARETRILMPMEDWSWLAALGHEKTTISLAEMQVIQRKLAELEEEKSERDRRAAIGRAFRWVRWLAVPVTIAVGVVSGIVAASTGRVVRVPVLGTVARLMTFWAIWSVGSELGMMGRPRPGGSRGIDFRKSSRN